MSPYLYHLVGYTSEGRRVNRRYKTYGAMRRMAAKMTWSSCSMLQAVSLSAFENAPQKKEGTKP